MKPIPTPKFTTRANGKRMATIPLRAVVSEERVMHIAGKLRLSRGEAVRAIADAWQGEVDLCGPCIETDAPDLGEGDIVFAPGMGETEGSES